MDNVVVKYRKKFALNGCSMEVPAGRLVALVGANGAGKTTLLSCIGGLELPTSGEMNVLNDLEAGSLEARSRIAFVAQDTPLYRHLTIDQMIFVAEHLNQTFDRSFCYSRFRELNLQANMRIKNLSLGQQAQVSLTIALARHPDLLILDEPLARLDPVARNRFMEMVLNAAVAEGVSVIFSSHAISELEPVADFLILLRDGQVCVAEDIDIFVGRHRLLSGPTLLIESLPKELKILKVRSSGRHSQIIVGADSNLDLNINSSAWENVDVHLEELILAYLTSVNQSNSSTLSESFEASR
jgi:ABC-2 type transport system ATP-binding protein